MEATPPKGGENRIRKFAKRALGWLTLQGLAELMRRLLQDL
ncbi:hypothetical protein ACF058_08120 [Streptomyces sp. NPDC015501]